MFKSQVYGLGGFLWRLLISNAEKATPPNFCDDLCADDQSFFFCSLVSTYQFCAFPAIKSQCKLSCRMCTKCSPKEPECTEDLCVDQEMMCPSFAARGMCNMKAMKGMCDLSCKFCGPRCRYPPLPTDCSNDCADETKDCKFYKSDGHCDAGSEWKHVRQKCKLTCGLCRKCDDHNAGIRLLIVNATTTDNQTIVTAPTVEYEVEDPISLKEIGV